MKVQLTLSVIEGTAAEVAELAKAIGKLLPCHVDLSVRINDAQRYLFNENVYDLLAPLSTRTINCLKNENIIYVGDLIQKTEAEMLRIQNFGQKGLRELREKLARFDIGFNHCVKDWTAPED